MYTLRMDTNTRLISVNSAGIPVSYPLRLSHHSRTNHSGYHVGMIHRWSSPGQRFPSYPLMRIDRLCSSVDRSLNLKEKKTYFVDRWNHFIDRLCSPIDFVHRWNHFIDRSIVESKRKKNLLCRSMELFHRLTLFIDRIISSIDFVHRSIDG
jgi:hypothetical protein